MEYVTDVSHFYFFFSLYFFYLSSYVMLESSTVFSLVHSRILKLHTFPYVPRFLWGVGVVLIKVLHKLDEGIVG